MDSFSTQTLVEHFRKQSVRQIRGGQSFASHIDRATGKKGNSIVMIGPSGAPKTVEAISKTTTAKVVPTSQVEQSVQQAENIIKHVEEESKHPPITTPTVDGLSNLVEKPVSLKKVSRVTTVDQPNRKVRRVKRRTKKKHTDIFS